MTSERCSVCSGNDYGECEPFCIRDMAKELVRELSGLSYDASYDHDTYSVILEINERFVKHLLFEPKEDGFYDIKVVTAGNPGRLLGTVELDLIPTIAPALVERFISTR